MNSSANSKLNRRRGELLKVADRADQRGSVVSNCPYPSRVTNEIAHRVPPLLRHATLPAQWHARPGRFAAAKMVGDSNYRQSGRVLDAPTLAVKHSTTDASARADS